MIMRYDQVQVILIVVHLQQKNTHVVEIERRCWRLKVVNEVYRVFIASDVL